MIKTAVYAYWAKPFLEKESYSNFERKNDLLVSLRLSVEQSRKFFDKIVFYGDHEAIAQICNVVKFDEVYDDVEELNEKNIPSYFYSLPKVVACEKMKEPFVLIENDFYLWDIPKSSNFFEAPLIVEDFHETPIEFYDEIDRMQEKEMATRPRWYRLAKKGKFSIPQKGIYGGNDIKFINEHALEVMRLIDNEINLEIFQSEENEKLFKNTHLIYDLWYCGAKIDSTQTPSFALRDSDIKYTHLYAEKKNDPEVSIKLYERVRKDLPDFMKKIDADGNGVYDPVENYDYFIEPTPGIPNIEIGKKKLTFVMALMNRKHQIEKTLIKNLEDNWEDREDVEFVLMDVSSKDGFREWLQEQKLDKYTKSGYLRCFETDVIDTWHASIGKNTATHQAHGRIVVTLDCDNFTGFRGGKFVIEHFEKHNYNCVMHQFDWNPKNGNFGRIAITKNKFDEIGGYDQSLLPMGYQDWDIIKRAEATGCKYINPVDAEYNQAITNEGGKELSMANTIDAHKKMGWTEMNRINKLKCHHNLYRNKHKANEGYYGIRSNIRRILDQE
ncbi:MAG: glycosyltransferase family 2 protein [Flavobacteriaceae bacterium TMED42]|nr:MAG: glycosyltransferase family 2 protein [Flavobacteriaceae bacterium TMED42]